MKCPTAVITKNAGFTLLEILLTLAVAAIVMAAVGSVIASHSALTRDAYDRSLAQMRLQECVGRLSDMLEGLPSDAEISFDDSGTADAYRFVNPGDDTYSTVVFDPDSHTLTISGYSGTLFNGTDSETYSHVYPHVTAFSITADIPISPPYTHDNFWPADVKSLRIEIDAMTAAGRESKTVHVETEVGLRNRRTE